MAMKKTQKVAESVKSLKTSILDKSEPGVRFSKALHTEVDTFLASPVQSAAAAVGEDTQQQEPAKKKRRR